MLLAQCKCEVRFEEFNLDQRLNYYCNGKLYKNEDIFGKGNQGIRYSYKLLGRKGDYDSTSEEKENEYEYKYEEDEEEITI
jgi:hypothetical protein